MSSESQQDVNKVLLVGHCGFDASSLEQFVRDIVADATGQAADDVRVQMVNDEERLLEVTDEQSLLLVNRVLDGRFAARSGPSLIERLNQSGVGAKMLLISNYADAQQQAESVGALPGFGKSEVGGEAAAARLRAALHAGDNT